MCCKLACTKILQNFAYKTFVDFRETVEDEPCSGQLCYFMNWEKGNKSGLSSYLNNVSWWERLVMN